ncbi:MAG: ribonuclease HI [Syntrophales bacterium]
MGRTQKRYYAVARGARPGVYETWFGPAGAEGQVRGVPGALYRVFATRAEAEQWLKNPLPGKAAPKSAVHSASSPAPAPAAGTIMIYTDGGCFENPGPGGYGAVIVAGEQRTELSEGFRLTTNNRMELMACIAALTALKTPSAVILHSDSRYVVNGIAKGWARAWRANNWMRANREPAENSDLWERLLALCDRHRVSFVWVKGHAGHRENERCDELATAAGRGAELHADKAYVEGRTRIPDRLFGSAG